MSSRDAADLLKYSSTLGFAQYSRICSFLSPEILLNWELSNKMYFLSKFLKKCFLKLCKEEIIFFWRERETEGQMSYDIES